jgi:hypothetical protein
MSPPAHDRFRRPRRKHSLKQPGSTVETAPGLRAVHGQRIRVLRATPRRRHDSARDEASLRHREVLRFTHCPRSLRCDGKPGNA